MEALEIKSNMGRQPQMPAIHMKRQEPPMVLPKEVTMLCRHSGGDSRPATSAPTTEWGGGAGGYVEGDGTQDLLDHRAGSVFKVDPMCYMAMSGPTAALSGVVQMSKNEGKQVLSSDTEVNARSIRGLLHPPVLG